jgi:hypothetical protein
MFVKCVPPLQVARGLWMTAMVFYYKKEYRWVCEAFTFSLS